MKRAASALEIVKEIPDGVDDRQTVAPCICRMDVVADVVAIVVNGIGARPLGAAMETISKS